MENIDFTFNENAFHIEGFPDAVKVMKITGPKSKRLADLYQVPETLTRRAIPKPAFI
ncbi:hypothetical protein K9U39_02340 [Rhodoblastus acidophilus]|uniref:Uncharacterized protein n=1 Tax=Candidatus Rhodoblastus alkanivorans TaxID=2954117 RepID=A0ABS9Z5X1_9HYPH|nr:hypothetical protein [Candidatus Rhodoblastus alkanivorans]MCI4680766.1 hypothetical protein [Candidatus Rhodoblastus alkanivorans]MCI4682486.1 hypothetical protein [Candidatus Rhodoblastus alkanivorans]MDI4639792.1 hypothetical protein [Rhodoblastus acidophilus]